MNSAILFGLVIGTLVSEDLTTIGAGLLAREGAIDLLPAIAVCAAGVYLGDLGLWALGRMIGRRALTWSWVQRRFDSAMLTSFSAPLEQRMGLTVFASRFLPGSRLPMYLAFGISGRRPVAFAGWSLAAVLLWTPLLVLLTATYGSSLTSSLLGQLGDASRLVVASALLVSVLRLATRALSRLASWRSSVSAP